MKSIIIYFSHAGENWMETGIQNIQIGNTEIVAKKLKQITNSDIIKIEEQEPYPINYQECCKKAKQELEKNIRPKIKQIPNIENYTTIYILTPIWYSHMPMPLFTALENQDFKNKTIKYIVTHEGSGLGQIPNDIKQLCKDANIKQGLAIIGHNAQNIDQTLQEWCKQ